ncbi:hypothetical protein BDW75DRAFT_241858 [Aspergillus navahoensis]
MRCVPQAQDSMRHQYRTPMSRGLVCQSVTSTNTPGAPAVAPHSKITETSPPWSPEGNPLSSSSSCTTASAAVVHHGLVQPRSVGRIESPSPSSQAASENVQILEDAPGRTAHSMGFAAEQDPYFLSLFGSVLLSERDGIDAKYVQVHNGGPGPNDHPIHFLLLQDEFPAHTNEAMQKASDAIEALVWPHSAALVRLYFRHVHPALSIVSRGRFLRQYHADKEGIPASLRGAIYALACVFWRRDESLPTPCPFEQYQMANHAHESLRRELEAPNMFKLQACLLLMHVMPPGIDSVESPSIWILAAQATAELWWAVYITDCWSAVCHGNPPHIGAESFNTPRPDMDDLRFDEEVPVDLQYLVDSRNVVFRVEDRARFLEMVRLACSMRAILDCSCQVDTTAESRTCLVAVHEGLREWRSLMPSCSATGTVGKNGPLYLSYYAAQALLFRGLMYPTARAAPNSSLRQWLSVALKEFETFTTFMATVTEEDLAGFWIRHSRSQLILCGNLLIYLFLLATEPRDIEVAYQLLESLHHSMQRLDATPDVSARLIIRPTMLRINSFAQATELISHARTVGQVSPVMSP